MVHGLVGVGGDGGNVAGLVLSSLWYWLTSLGWAEGWLWTAAAWAPWALAMVVVTVGALPSLTAWWCTWSAEARASTERTATKAFILLVGLLALFLDTCKCVDLLIQGHGG